MVDSPAGFDYMSEAIGFRSRFSQNESGDESYLWFFVCAAFIP